MTTENDRVKIPKQVLRMVGTVPAAQANPGDAPIPPAPVVDSGASAIPAPPAAKVEAPQGDHDWKQMYLTIKGKYDVEVPALTRRVRELTEQLEAARTAAVVRAGKASDVLTAEQREELGEEVLTPVSEMVEQVRKESAQEIQALRRQIFFDRLDVMVSGWRDTNVNPEFIAWLDGTVPLTGKKRFEVFNSAVENGDATTAAQFFRAFSEEIAASKQTVPGLDGVVLPQPVKTGGGAEPSKPVYKESDVTRFYSDLSKGRYRSNPAEAVRLEAEIGAAVKEGRVIKG